jgi:hypothetical protein
VLGESTAGAGGGTFGLDVLVGALFHSSCAGAAGPYLAMNRNAANLEVHASAARSLLRNPIVGLILGSQAL